MTLRITGPTDEPTRRYVDDTVQKTFVGPTVKLFRTPQGVNAELDPIEDPKAVVAKLTFGEVVSVEGRTVTVKVGAVVLPVPTEQELALALNDLKSTDRGRRKTGAERLTKMYAVVPARREEIAKALETVALEKDLFVRMPALGALVLWSGPENVPALIKVIETGEGQARVAAANLLAKHKDPAAAAVLAKCLTAGFERGSASAALKAIGPGAEKAVIPYLTHKDSWTSSEACHVLKEIGTEASVVPLQEVLKGKPDFMVGPAASNALKAIQERQKARPKK